ncbi:MAG TPA: hypothetical protein VFS19_03565 [Planctomycetota bacterium]|nr:hypothetical protein [Planctomycetota bacterium]
MNSNRLRPRRLDEPERGGRRRAVPPPGQAPDRTGLYVGLAVGGGVLVLALAFAMSSGKSQEPGRVDRSADRGLKEDMEAAQKLAADRKLSEALFALESAIQNPAYRSSNLLPKARAQADQYRKQIVFEREASEAIAAYDKKVTAAKDGRTIMKSADAFWREGRDLLNKYRSTRDAVIVDRWLSDLDRLRGTNAQDDWQKEFPYTRDRIKALVDAESFSEAIKQWRQWSEPFDSHDLKAKVQGEITTIDKLAVAAANKLVQAAGTGPRAKAMLEEAQSRFNDTAGLDIINRKLRTLN